MFTVPPLAAFQTKAVCSSHCQLSTHLLAQNVADAVCFAVPNTKQSKTVKRYAKCHQPDVEIVFTSVALNDCSFKKLMERSSNRRFPELNTV